MSTDSVQALNASVAGDDGMQFYLPLDAGHSCDMRINRFHSIYKLRLSQSRNDAPWASEFYVRGAQTITNAFRQVARANWSRRCDFGPAFSCPNCVVPND